jgi:hypothetical protein
MKFIDHLKAGRIVVEWYDVPVHFFQTTRNDQGVYSSDMAKYIADLAKRTNVADITNAAEYAAVEYVRMPFLRCTDCSFLFGNEFPLLLIPSQYISLCNEIFAYTGTNNKFIVDGNSGVGKSMFIYYFMYRLHKQSANPPSFQVKNMCSQANDEGTAEKVASSDDTRTSYDWGIFDNTNRFGSTTFKSILLVTSDPERLYLPSRYAKGGGILGPARYLCMPAWSYAYMCALGLSPRLSTLKSLEVTLPTGASSVDNKSSVRFHVIHPLYILVHFISFRSTPRELSSGRPISYITAGPDGRINSATAPNPEFLFLKRSEPASVTAPYAPFESVFDRSYDDIKSCLWVSSVKMSFKGDDSRCGLSERPVYVSVDGASTDASQLTSLGKLEPKHQAASTVHTHMLKAAYLAVALDLARAMRTSTDNKQYRIVLRAIFPFLCTAISDGLEGLCDTVSTAATDSSLLDSSSHIRKHMITGSLTFRVHPLIIHTEPEHSRAYGDHMPQHLSIFGSGASVSIIHDTFLYYFRSTMIASVVMEHLCASESGIVKTLLAFIIAACGSSGLGILNRVKIG